MRPSPEARAKLILGRTGAILGIAAACLALTIAQLALGGELVVSTMFSGATFFGLLAVEQAGATSAIGLLNLLLVGRILLGAFVAKNLLLGQPVSAGMFAPETTSETMLLGFAGVWLATCLATRTVRPLRVFGGFENPERLFALFVFMLVFSTGSAIAVRIAGNDNQVLTGGAWGIAKFLAGLRALSLPVLMLYLWRTGSPRWLSHPGVVGLATALFLLGVLSTSKQYMAEPIAYYAAMGVARYGLRHPFVWLGIPAFVASYVFYIQPVGQYARNVDPFDQNALTALQARGGVAIDYLLDSSFRAYVREEGTRSIGHFEEGSTYLPKDLVAFGRLALVGEADRLIDATEHAQFTKWETIVNSLLLAVPHFLLPNKPQLPSGNFLGRYTGDLPQSDLTTQISYGFMANAFNAFGLDWVLPLSLLTALAVMIPILLFTSGPVFANPWSMFAVALVHQSYVESSFGGLLGAFDVFVVALIVLGGARVLHLSLAALRSPIAVSAASARREGALPEVF